MGDPLACHIVAHQNTAAVRIALQTLLIEFGVQLTGVRFGAKQLGSFFQHTCPRVHIVGAVIAVHHGHRLAGRSSDQVDFLVNVLQRPLQNHHGKNGGSGRYVAGAGRHCIGGGHAGTRITFCRRKRNSHGKQMIQHGGTGLRQCTGLLSCHQHTRKDILQFPWQIAIRNQMLKLFHHGGIVIYDGTVNGENTGCLADAHSVLAGEHIVDIACQRCNVGNLVHMVFPVQDRLIQMRYTPALGNIEPKQLGQFRCRLSGDGVLPGAERNQQIPILVKSKITVHHGRNTHGANKLPLRNTAQSRFQADPNLIQRIGPDAVFIGTFPGIISGRNRSMGIVNRHRLNTCRAKFDAQVSFRIHFTNAPFCMIDSFIISNDFFHFKFWIPFFQLRSRLTCSLQNLCILKYICKFKIQHSALPYAKQITGTT